MLTIIDTVLLAIAVLYIVALLRSHADILRRLSLLEDADARAGRAPADAAAPAPGIASDVDGVTLDGEPVTISASNGPTLLAFMTSGCASCRSFWEDLSDAGTVAELNARVAIVAHDLMRESVTRLRELAPPDIEVILSSSAWRDYAVPSSPHFVLLDGARGIAGRGSAINWQQLVTLVGDAAADASDAADGAERRVRTTGERAARAERALGRAGITAGHPSLYPSQSGDSNNDRDGA